MSQKEIQQYPLLIVTKTSSYTPVLGDINTVFRMNSASANNFTLPLNVSVAFPIGTTLSVRQVGVGVTSIVVTVGVTLNGATSVGGQYKNIVFVKVGTDTWDAWGGVILTPLSAPSLSTAVVSNIEIAVTGGAVANASSYVLEWSPNGSTGWMQLTTSSGVYAHDNLTAATAYYYRYKAVGDGITYSDSNYATVNDTTTNNTFPMYLLETNGADTSGNSLNLTVVGSPSFVVGKVGNAVQLNGSSQQLNRAVLSGLRNGFGLNFWFKYTSVSPTGYSPIMGTYGVATQSEWLIYRDNTYKLASVLSGDGITLVTNGIGSGASTVGTWYMASLVYVGGGSPSFRLKLYGEFDVTITASVPASLFAGSGTFIIGADGGGNYGVPVIIDQVRLYPAALLDTNKITALYNAGVGI